MANYKNSPTSELKEDKTPRVSRNWHDRSHRNSTSLPVGRVVPILCEFLQGNSTVKLDINSAVQTTPTSSPVFGTMSVDIKSIFCSLRHYVVGLYGNNLLENDFVEDISFPLIEAASEYDELPCNALGGLLAHLRYPRVTGVLCVGSNGSSRTVFAPLRKSARITGNELYKEYTNAGTGDKRLVSPYNSENPLSGMNGVPILAYIDACLHYCVDPFDRVIPFESTLIVESAGELEVQRELVGIEYDSLMNLIYESKGFSVPETNIEDSTFNVQSLRLGINSADESAVTEFSLLPQYLPDSETGTSADAINSIAQLTFNDGLFPITFKPDLFTSWYDDEQVNKLTAVSFDNGNYTGLRLAQAEYNRLANNLIKGQTYADYVDTTYGYNLKMCDHPILVGTDTYHIRFQDIVNTAARMGTGVQEVPLGTAVARGYASSSLNKTIHFTSQEPGYLLVLASLVPSVSYTEDVPAHLRFTKLGDTPNRFFDAAGFRNLKVGEAYFTSTAVDDFSMGSQPFYYYNMLSYDRVSGLLATEGFNSYSFIRDFDVSVFGISFRDGSFEFEGSFVDAFRSKYVNGSQFDYAFPANAPISVGEEYTAIANATAQNYYFVFYFDLRVLEPLSNQVIARATF